MELWDIATDDLWCRDSGPLFAVREDGQLIISDIQFNGWGNKQLHSHDGKIAGKVAERLQLPLIDARLVREAGEVGGVEHNRDGLLIAHESSWVIDNRNPGLSRREIEERRLEACGATSMIWSKGLKNEDITDYHIDSLLRLTSSGEVLINLPKIPDPYDPFHQAAQETYEAVKEAGLSVDVIFEREIRRVGALDFVASYANYYVCNGGVIAAQFGDAEADALARDAVKRHYRDRDIVMLNVDPLGEVGGGIHCATQQMPAVG